MILSTFFSTSPPSLDELYVKGTFDEEEYFYKIDKVCGLTRIVPTDENELHPIFTGPFSKILTADHIDHVQRNLKYIYREYQKTLDIIKNVIGCRFLGNGFQILAHITELDLSNRDINIIPPQIKFLKCLEKLNVSNNHLRLLPAELAELSLVVLNLYGNKQLLLGNLLDWIEKIELVICPDGSMRLT
jgi:Leucine-rich repeat (LRR) protein